MEHMLPPEDGPLRPSTAYFSGTLDPVASASSGFNFGGVPMPGGNGSVNPGESGEVGVAYTSNFPLMPLMVSSSIAVYKGQQERFQKVRMRFLTATTTIYPYVAANNAAI